jgi:hypothetical protein
VSQLLHAMRDELVTAGLVRTPRTAGVLPPLWVDPRDGVPAPGEGSSSTEIGATMVLGAFPTGGFPRQPFEKMLRRDTVDLHFRALKSPDIFTLEAQITDRLIDRRNWTMGGDLTVIECEQWRPLQPLDRDEHGFTYVVSYWFETYA